MPPCPIDQRVGEGDVIEVGDLEAESLGLNVARLRMVVVIAASPCASQISPVADGSKKRSASTSLTPSFPTTMKPTFLAPGFNFT